MATVHDPRLQESITLQRDPALADPVHVPWTGMGLAAVALLVALLVFLYRRRARPVAAVVVVPEPIEDTLAALEGIWRQTRPDNISPSITALAAVMRRYLSRSLSVDCTTATTLELTAHFSRSRGDERVQEALLSLRTAFFETADQIRFACLPATVMTVRGLYETARDFVKKQEAARPAVTGENREQASPPNTPSEAQPAKPFSAEVAEFAETKT